MGFDLREGGEREVIKVNGITGMGKGEEGDERGQWSWLSVCLSPVSDHHNLSYLLIQINS